MSGEWWKLEGARFIVRLPGIETGGLRDIAILTSHGAVTLPAPDSDWAYDYRAICNNERELALQANMRKLREQPELATGSTTVGELALWLLAADQEDHAQLCVGQVELAPCIYWDRHAISALLAPLLRRQLQTRIGHDTEVAVSLRELEGVGLTLSITVAQDTGREVVAYAMPKPIPDTAYDTVLSMAMHTTDAQRLELRHFRVAKPDELDAAVSAARHWARVQSGGGVVIEAEGRAA